MIAHGIEEAEKCQPRRLAAADFSGAQRKFFSFDLFL
jgi:hypothetical protein